MADREKNLKKPFRRDQEDALAKRLDKFKARLKENSLDAFIVSSSPNKHFLTGWETDSESGWLVISQDKAYVLTDFRYTEQAEQATKNFEVIEYDVSLPKFFGEFSRSKVFKRVGFESENLSLLEFKKIQKFSKPLHLEAKTGFVEESRSVKDHLEIKNIKRAVDIADKAFEYILGFVKVGMSEMEIAWEMEKYMR